MHTQLRKQWYDQVPWWVLGIVVIGLVILTSVAAIMAIAILRGPGDAGGVLTPEQTTTPSPGSLVLLPTEGKPGTSLSLLGQGWPAGATIIVGLGDPSAGQSPQIDPDAVMVASSVDSAGQFSVSFTYPVDGPWASRSQVSVVAQAQPAGLASSAAFHVLVPSPSETPTPAPQASPIAPTLAATSTFPAVCTDRIGFVADVTIPDNTTLIAGSTFDKTWRLKNTGTCTWNTGYDVVFVAGNRMNGPQVAPLTSTVAPGATVDVKVSLTAPSQDGTYLGEWELRNDRGLLFGLGSSGEQPFWVKIKVGYSGSTVNGTWKGEYFDNATLKGKPKVTRNDALINFDWQRGSPAAGIPADNFSVRWTGKAELDAATYRFHVTVDDGARLYVDDQLVLDSWKDGSVREITTDVSVTKSTHTIRLEYYEHTHDARVRLAWEKLSSTSFKHWKAQYWSNRELKGTPALVRDEKSIDYDWKDHSPAVGLPADNFSARWTQKIHFDDGTYRFRAVADDAVRVSVDGKWIINEWHDGSGSTTYAVDQKLKGDHTIVVEYYEHSGEASVKVWIERQTTPTPSLTPSATVTPSPTITISPTSSPTPSVTPSATASSTPSETPTPTTTPTSTPEATSTETPLPTDIAP